MKKKILTTIFAGAMALSLTACNLGGAKTDGKDTVDADVMNTVESVYGVGAVTTAKLLAATEAKASSLAVVLDGEADATEPEVPETPTEPETPVEPTEPTEPDVPTTPETPTEPDYGLPESGDATDKAQSEAEKFNRYFNMLEGFMQKGATSTAVSENDSADPALAAFEYKLVVTGKDEKGEESVHVLYYTETLLDSRDFDDDDHDDDDDDDRDHDDDDEQESEVAYSLEGVLEMGTDESGAKVYYYMTGYRSEESETEKDESEVSGELWIRASAVKGDRRNYVEMSHETETEQDGKGTETETEYTYSVYSDGRLVESTEVGFETEGNGAEYELEYTAGGVRSYYEIELVTRGTDTWVNVEYNIGGSRGKFVILRDADGNYEYKFSDDKADDRHFDRFD